MRDDAFSTPQALGGLRVVSLEKLRVAAVSLDVTRANSGLCVSSPGGVPNKAQVKTSRSATSRFAPLRGLDLPSPAVQVLWSAVRQPVRTVVLFSPPCG